MGGGVVWEITGQIAYFLIVEWRDLASFEIMSVRTDDRGRVDSQMSRSTHVNQTLLQTLLMIVLSLTTTPPSKMSVKISMEESPEAIMGRCRADSIGVPRLEVAD
ncbi:hypothetical protein CEXT_719721 [Caerostris extrusa]|uniref:Uncharacterized protein n=1 Tax=Caerostris extrusa TaxID=172846 RepID=A0AAV4W310_CAEEX|nr:hypothetical protein CEXT_719721 [Caerostris extrusa]